MGRQLFAGETRNPHPFVHSVSPQMQVLQQFSVFFVDLEFECNSNYMQERSLQLNMDAPDDVVLLRHTYRQNLILLDFGLEQIPQLHPGQAIP